MTEKEKAEELIRNFFPSLKDSLKLELLGIRKKYSKRCALIVVDELIKETGSKYWYNVKQELEKL